MFEDGDFSQLFSEYSPGILRYLRNRGLSLPDAEDLTQEIFLYAYKHIDSFDKKKSAFVSWLYLITRSRLKNWYRDHANVTENECYTEKEPSLLDVEPTPEQAIELSETREKMARALLQLDVVSRNIVLQKYIYGMSSEQIAQLHRLREGHVRVILSRALKKLRQAIAASEEG